MIHLATGIAIREEHLLMVASRYPNQPQPLWNLPGGRQQQGELLEETVVREFLEETSLHVSVRELAYVSESYDGDRHFLNATFLVDLVDGVATSSFDRLRMTQGEPTATHGGGDHVVGVEWVALGDVRERVAVAVVREPLVAFLEGRLERRYAGYLEAGITIEWPDDSA
jgi:ADP-ribose pyrophosphatase YjhB (NUDIX family)